MNLDVSNILRPQEYRARPRSRTAAISAALLALFLSTKHASAHATEQVFVLLLPTEVYTSVGTGIVMLTILMLVVLPGRLSRRLFSTVSLPFTADTRILQVWSSLLSTMFLGFLIYSGVTGTRDPLTNLLTSFVWTVWWILIFAVQGMLGDIWRWINPWTGLHSLLQSAFRYEGGFRLPKSLGAWPGIIAYFWFVAFLLADVAPADPDRLALVVGLYWIYTFIGMTIFGRADWLERCECFTMFFRFLARISPFRFENGTFKVGLPGWKLTETPTLFVTQAVFLLVALASSSFDGLNETFWWYTVIGVNPLEFPGRSFVIWQTLLGIVGSIVLLLLAFGTSVYCGRAIMQRLGPAESSPEMSTVFGRLALSLLPIVFGYHLAHFYPTFLVNWQYTLVGLSDPFSTGADYLDLGHHFVTTGFFNQIESVRLIWLTQCAFIVAGHVLAVLVGHRIIVDMFGRGWRSVVAEIPLSILMILYTLLSLWLLASPKGG